MTTLVVSGWHAFPELLVEQIENYNDAFDGDLIHCININSECKHSFTEEAERQEIDFSRFENVYFTYMKTGHAMLAHAYFNAVLHSISQGRRFDHVYFHTSSDLLIKRDIKRHIQKYDLGFSRHEISPFNLEMVDGHMIADVKTPAESFRDAMKLDRRLPAVLRGMNVEWVYKSRAEGCFFRRDLFFEIMYPLLCQTSISDMAELPKAYPIEEYLFGTCVEFFCARHKVRRTGHVIATSANQGQFASLEEMEEVLANPLLFGIKRFQRELDDSMRVHARRLLRGNYTA